MTQFVESLKDHFLECVGSKNQNVIDVKKRIEQVSNLK